MSWLCVNYLVVVVVVVGGVDCYELAICALLGLIVCNDFSVRSIGSHLQG